jgi:hypothetical protein
MKKIGIYMNVLMSITLSLFLSLANSMASGHFTVSGFFLSLAVSFAISLAVGFIVPMHKVGAAACRRVGLSQEDYSTRFFEALISDIIYTPVMTFSMVTMEYMIATSHGARLEYLPMLGKSLLLSFILGYLLALLFMPIFRDMLLKKYGPPRGRPHIGETTIK